MAVHLTRMYTRTGDDGTSGLGDFTRVPKLDSFILPGGTPGAGR